MGDAKLSYLGFSYGSYLGNTYANLFPNRIRALVIDGVLDPRLWSSGWQVRSDRVATEAVFEEFLRLCDAAGPQCAFFAASGSAARWEAVAASIRREPLVVDAEFTYTYDLLIADAAGAMYAPEIWADYAAFLDQVADLALADQPAAALVTQRERLLQRLTAPQQEADYPNFFGRVLRQPVRRHRVSEAVLDLPRDRGIRRTWFAVRSVLVVAKRRLRRLADRPRPVRRPVDGADVGPGPGGGQLLRPCDRLRRRPCQRQAAAQQPAVDVRRLGPHRLRTQRLQHDTHRPLPAHGGPAAAGHHLPRKPQPVPRCRHTTVNDADAADRASHIEAVRVT